MFVTWTIDGATGYIPVRPVFLGFTKTTNIPIYVDDILFVRAGGRSDPKKVVLARAPFDKLIVNISPLGNEPKYLDTYPK